MIGLLIALQAPKPEPMPWPFILQMATLGVVPYVAARLAGAATGRGTIARVLAGLSAATCAIVVALALSGALTPVFPTPLAAIIWLGLPTLSAAVGFTHAARLPDAHSPRAERRRGLS
ncbi:MAG: hypothetical protein ACFCUN_11525 [Hyphomicrobiaceae bacterium]